MNTEKLEKLKKSLDNKFIPDNVKDKIRNEIEKLESEIKSEEMSASAIKKEVAKVEDKVEVAVDKAEQKAESTEPKKGRGRPRKTPATKPVEPKATETAIKKTAMVVAKTIRKDGEKWNDAMKRANGVMKKEKVEVKKTTKSELDRLLARVRKNKSLMSELKGVKDLRRDAMRTAKPVGKRISESGNVYYEYRPNKTDRKTYGKYAFAGGGNVAKISFEDWLKKNNIEVYKRTYYWVADDGGGDYMYSGSKGDVMKSLREDYKKSEKFELGGSVVTDLAGHTGGSLGTGNKGMLDGFSNTAYTGLVGETGAMSSGEMFMSGGKIDKNFDLSGYKKWITFNNLEEAKEYVDMDRKKYPRVKESVVIKEGNKFQVWVIPATGVETGNRVYANGGGLKFGNLGENRSTKFIDDNYEVIVYPEKLEILIIITNEDTINQEGLDNSGVKWREEDFGYSIEADNKTEFNKAIKVILGVNKRFADGGSVGMANQQVIDDASQGYVNYYLGEGASQGIYKDGGAIKNQYAGRTPEDVWNSLSVMQRKHFLLDHISNNEDEWSNGEEIQQLKYRDLGEDYREFIDLYSKSEWKKLSGDIKKAFREHIKEGQYAKGGEIEFQHSNLRIVGTGIDSNGNRIVKVSFPNQKAFSIQSNGNLPETHKLLKNYNKNLNFSVGEIELMEDEITDYVENYGSANQKKSLKIYGSMLDKNNYAKGGGVRKVGNREYSTGRNWTNDHRHTNKSEEHEVNYTRKGKFLGVFAKGGGVEIKHYKVDGKTFIDYMDAVDYCDMKNLSYNKIEKTTEYAKGGGVRKVGNREYSTGRNWTNDHRHTNKSENHEVNYNRKRFFAGGGSVNDDTPKIYVADLEAYNNGRLSGVWLDLTDYSDADELMDAINDFLKTTGGEEYAVHDYENLPSSMYSEYMGVRDFEEIYEMMDLAKENDLPLDVAMEVVSQFDRSALDEFTGVYDSEQDFAEQLVDDIGIQSFNDFQYYLEVSDTDRRLLSQDMADGYVDDIRNEDGGNRLIEEAGLDVEEYEESDSERQDEMLDEAREIVYDEYYNNYFEGLSDPYYFLVEEQGLYDAESFANANFVRVDYEKLADALEQDYTFVRHDGQIYVFNIR